MFYPHEQFRVKLTATMIIDYGVAWLIEIVMKALFSDNTPRPIVTKGLERREARRRLELEKEAREAAEAAVDAALGGGDEKKER
jgi:cation-transporting ATPase 13A1